MRWVTNARPHVDRCATAWLIRKRIDPRATFGFLAPGEEPPKGTRPFDLPGARYGHRGRRCTFETALSLHGLGKDPGLRAVARVVHDLDFHAMREPESAGLDAVLRGILLEEKDDRKVLARAAPVFDALAAYLAARPGGTGRRRGARRAG